LFLALLSTLAIAEPVTLDRGLPDSVSMFRSVAVYKASETFKGTDCSAALAAAEATLDKKLGKARAQFLTYVDGDEQPIGSTECEVVGGKKAKIKLRAIATVPGEGAAFDSRSLTGERAWQMVDDLRGKGVFTDRGDYDFSIQQFEGKLYFTEQTAYPSQLSDDRRPRGRAYLVYRDVLQTQLKYWLSAVERLPELDGAMVVVAAPYLNGESSTPEFWYFCFPTPVLDAAVNGARGHAGVLKTSRIYRSGSAAAKSGELVTVTVPQNQGENY